MKTPLRILIILAVAAVVVGATAGLTRFSAVQAAISSTGAGHHHANDFADKDSAAGAASGQSGSQALTNTDQQGSAPAGARPDEARSHDGGSLAGLPEVLKNLAIVLAASLLFAAGSWLNHRLRPRRRPAAAPRAVKD